MTVTPGAIDAQRCSIALIQAVRLRGSIPATAVTEVLRDANLTHGPIAIELSLAALTQALAANMEAQVADLLADPELLEAAAAAARYGHPLEPNALGITADLALHYLGLATAMQEPG